LQTGQQFVASQGFNLADFDLQDSHAEKRKAREDYTLTWQARHGYPLDVAEAHYRLEVHIAGNQVVAFSRYFKLPEDWVRREGERKLVNVALWVATLLAGAGLFAGIFWLFVRQVRANQMRWRPALPVSIALGLVFLLSEFNTLNLVNAQYNTSLPLTTFELYIVVSYLVVTLAVALLGWVLVAFATSLYPEAWRIFRGAARHVWARDAVVALAAALALGAGIDNLGALVFSHFHAYASLSGDILNPSFATIFPGGGFLLRGFCYAVFSVAVLAPLVRLIMLGREKRSGWLWLGVALVVVSLGPASAHSPREFMVSWSLGFVQLVAAFTIIAFFLRDNIAAYLAVAFALPLVDPLLDLFSSSAPLYRWNGVALAAMAAVVLAWLLPWSKPRSA